jgi:hypothetical protein
MKGGLLNMKTKEFRGLRKNAGLICDDSLRWKGISAIFKTTRSFLQERLGSRRRG